jgi:hypothetical protein
VRHGGGGRGGREFVSNDLKKKGQKQKRERGRGKRERTEREREKVDEIDR